MTRITFVAFALLTGFFYITGKPVDETAPSINRFADLSRESLFLSKKTLEPASKSSLSSDQPESGHNISDAVETENPAGALALPARNPRRDVQRSLHLARPLIQPARKKIIIAKPLDKKASLDFGTAQNKFTGGSIKPLAVSYRQRYVKVQKPVLGPRLTAVLLLRELKRVGCYKGRITTHWNDSAKIAMQHFNKSTGSRLVAASPTIVTLEKLQQFTQTACPEKPVLIKPAILARGSAASSSYQVNKNPVTHNNEWRTKVKYKEAAFRQAPLTIAPRYNIPQRPSSQTVSDSASITYVRKPIQVIRRKARKVRKYRVAKRKFRRKRAIRSWRRHYRRKRFGFHNTGGSFSLNN